MKFLKKLAVYFIGTIFNKIIVFLLLPIYTANFDPASYGDNDLSMTTVTMLASLLFMEVWTPLLRFSYDEHTLEGKQKIFTNVVSLSGACFPLYIAGCVLIAFWQELPNPGWMIAYGLSLLILHIAQFEARAIGDSKDFMISGMVSSVFQFILSAVLIYGFRVGAVAILIAPAVSNVLAAMYIEARHRFLRKVRLKDVSKAMLRDLTKYSFPLAINAVAFWGMTNINRYFAKWYLSEDANGYIALANKFAALIVTLIKVYALAWQESAYEHSGSDQRSRYYSKMLVVYMDFMAFGTAAVIVGTNVLFPFFIDDAYTLTQLILPIYYLSAFANAMSNFYGHIFNAEKKTNILLYSTLLGAAVNIGLLYATIQIWGLYAVPIALTLGYLANVLMRILSIQKTVKVSFDLKRLALDIVVMAAACGIVYCGCSAVWKVLYGLLLCGGLGLLYREKLKTAMKTVRRKFR